MNQAASPAHVEAPRFDYVAEANVTASQQWHGELVNFFHFKTKLAQAIEALQTLDRMKKALFYGRDTGLSKPQFEMSCANMTASDNEKQIVHAIIGGATEAGEKLEQLYAWATGKIAAFDRVNLIEETGDGQWYDALLADALGFTFDEVQRINIAKLRARYKDKFDAYDANNRQLSFERSVLEIGASAGFRLDPAAAAVVQLQDLGQPVASTGLVGAFDPLPGMLLTPRQQHAATVAAGIEDFRAECSGDGSGVALPPISDEPAMMGQTFDPNC